MATAEAEAAAADEQARLDAEDKGKNGNGKTMAEIAEEQALEQQDELFVMEGDKAVSLRDLIARKTPKEFFLKMGTARVPGGVDMGLIAFSAGDLKMVVDGRPGKVTIDPTYNADGTVKKVAIVQTFKPRMFWDLDSARGREAIGLE